MSLKIVEDAGERIKNNPTIKLRLLELKEEIRQRYAADLAVSGLLARLYLEIKMSIEFYRERKRILPSPYSLYHTDKIKP